MKYADENSYFQVNMISYLKIKMIIILYTRSVVQKRPQAHLRMLSTKCVYKSYIFNKYV